VTVCFTVEEANSIEVAQSPSTHSRTTERFSVQAWTPQMTNIPNFLISLFFVCFNRTEFCNVETWLFRNQYASRRVLFTFAV
jgi:hypothetical protein